MPLQILILKPDGITAADYLTWCRDPEPAALGYALGSIAVRPDQRSETVTAVLDWVETPPPPPVAATVAGLALPAGTEVHAIAGVGPADREASEPARELVSASAAFVR